MNVLRQIQRALMQVFGMYLSSEVDAMSSEAKEIFSNPEDKEKYIKAVEKLRNTQGQKETITLSNQKTITLVS